MGGQGWEAAGAGGRGYTPLRKARVTARVAGALEHCGVQGGGEAAAPGAAAAASADTLRMEGCRGPGSRGSALEWGGPLAWCG